MDDHDRKIIVTLAVKVMGWRVVDSSITALPVFERPGETWFIYDWNPFKWSGAGQVMEAIRAVYGMALWHNFADALERALDSDTARGLIRQLSPRLIAEAAYAAVSESEETTS